MHKVRTAHVVQNNANNTPKARTPFRLAVSLFLLPVSLLFPTAGFVTGFVVLGFLLLFCISSLRSLPRFLLGIPSAAPFKAGVKLMAYCFYIPCVFLTAVFGQSRNEIIAAQETRREIAQAADQKQILDTSRRVDEQYEQAVKALGEADVAGAKRFLSSARQVFGATRPDINRVDSLSRKISDSENNNVIRGIILELVEPDYLAFKAHTKIPDSLHFGFKVLDDHAVAVANQLLADESSILSDRKLHLEQMAAEAEAKRQALVRQIAAERAEQSKDDWRKSDHSTMAFTMAKTFVEKSLKAPSTAKWSGITDDTTAIKRLDQNTYSVSSWVDSQNSFGAVIRTNYVVVLREAGDEWQLVSLKD